MYHIDFASRTPIYEQLYNNILQMISLNILKSDEKLPSVRTLAVDLGINPNTVSKVYKLLEQNGYIYTGIGRGSFIAPVSNKLNAERQLAFEEFEQSAKKAYGMGITKEKLINTINFL